MGRAKGLMETHGILDIGEIVAGRGSFVPNIGSPARRVLLPGNWSPLLQGRQHSPPLVTFKRGCAP